MQLNTVMLSNGLIVDTSFKQLYADIVQDKDRARLKSQPLLNDLMTKLMTEYKYLWSTLAIHANRNGILRAIDHHLDLNGPTNLKSILTYIENKELYRIEDRFYISQKDALIACYDKMTPDNEIALLSHLKDNRIIKEILPKMSKLKDTTTTIGPRFNINYATVNRRETFVLNSIKTYEKNKKYTNITKEGLYEKTPFWIIKYRKSTDPLEKETLIQKIFNANIPLFLLLAKKSKDKVTRKSIDMDILVSIAMEEALKMTHTFLDSSVPYNKYNTYMTNHFRWHLLRIYFRETMPAFMIYHPRNMQYPVIDPPLSLDVYYKETNHRNDYITASELLTDGSDLELNVVETIEQDDLYTNLAKMIAYYYINDDSDEISFIHGRLMIVLFYYFYFKGTSYNEISNVFNDLYGASITSSRVMQLVNKLIRQLRGHMNREHKDGFKFKDLFVDTNLDYTTPTSLESYYSPDISIENNILAYRQILWNKNHPLPAKSKFNNYSQYDLMHISLEPLIQDDKKRKLKYKPETQTTNNPYPDTEIIDNSIVTRLKNGPYIMTILLDKRATITVEMEDDDLYTMYYHQDYLNLHKANDDYYKIINELSEDFKNIATHEMDKFINKLKKYLNKLAVDNEQFD